MSSDSDPKDPSRDHRVVDAATGGDGGPSSRGIPLTSIGLCGLGMILVGSGMRRAVTEGWWVWLALAGMLILILTMAIVQERWLTRERHRLIASALKRTGTPGGSGRSKSLRTRTGRDSKPADAASTRRARRKRDRQDDGGAPPGSPPAPGGDAVGEEVETREELSERSKKLKKRGHGE